jgi:hypothetical protein
MKKSQSFDLYRRISNSGGWELQIGPVCDMTHRSGRVWRGRAIGIGSTLRFMARERYGVSDLKQTSKAGKSVIHLG